MLLNTLERCFRFFRAIGLVFAPKYYRNDPPNFKPEHFSNILSRTHVHLEIKTTSHWKLHCKYKSETRITEIFLLHTFSPAKPSLIFHHPSGEINHAFAYSIILGSGITRRFNVFLIKAQHHTSTLDFLNNTIDTFTHHQCTFAGSVLAVEAIVGFHHKETSTPLVVTGASMGGIVATLHAYFFGTADTYVPLVAYPNVGEIFLGDSYKFGMSDRSTKLKNPAYLDSFALKKPFSLSTAQKITPILGINDKIVLFKKAKEFWDNSRVCYIAYPYGHFTPAIMRAEVQRRILAAI